MTRGLSILTLLCLLGAGPVLPGKEPNLQGLIGGLGDPDGQVRARAAMTLALDREAARTALPALARALGDRNLNVRYWAASALQSLGPEAKVAVPELSRALRTFPGGVPELEGPPRYFADVRVLSAQALGAIGPAAQEAIPALEEAARDPQATVREAAIAALRAIRGE